MSTSLEDLETCVANRIQDAAGKLAQSSIDDCIAEALVGRYSQARPLTDIVDFTGDGETWYWDIISEFPNWDLAFSVITQAEYPADPPDPFSKQPNKLDHDKWLIYYPSKNAPQFRLTEIVPESGYTLRVTYTIPRQPDGSDAPPQDFYAICNLASAIACTRLAAIYTQLGDAAMGGDAVDYKARSAQYAALAIKYDKAFQVAFGLDKDQPQPGASDWTEWHDHDEAGGRRLIH